MEWSVLGEVTPQICDRLLGYNICVYYSYNSSGQWCCSTYGLMSSSLDSELVSDS